MGRDWSQFSWKHVPLVTSSSQVETFISCPRKWTFGKLFRLPQPRTSRGSLLGDAFHALAEAWLDADDTGRGADGRPVDPYKAVPDWCKDLTLEEADSVREGFDAAVSKGLLVRIPGRQTEVGWQFDLPGGVSFMGFTDLEGPAQIQDHKTTKSLRYAKTPTELKTDVQMMLCAHSLALRQGLSDDAQITLRHNTVQIGDKGTKIANPPPQTSVTVAHVKEQVEGWIASEARAMLALKKSLPPLEKWDTIPGPRRSDACSAYGGCPFAPICTKRQTPKMFQEHAQIFEGKAEEAKPAPAPSLPAGAPPWANASCFVCKGVGLMKGAPCVVCAASAKSRGVPTPKEAGATVLPDGRVTWTGATAQEVAKADVEVFAKVEAQEKPKAVATLTQPYKGPELKEPEPVKENEVPCEAVKEDCEATPKRGRGRPKGAKNKPKETEAESTPRVFMEDNNVELNAEGEMVATILTNLTLIRGTPVKVPSGTPTAFLGDILSGLADKIAQEDGTNFYAIPFLQRRDRLCAAALDAVKDLPNGTLIFAPRYQAGEFASAVDAVSLSTRVTMEIVG